MSVQQWQFQGLNCPLLNHAGKTIVGELSVAREIAPPGRQSALYPLARKRAPHAL